MRLNIPNMLSVLRILLVPVFCVVYFSDIVYANLYAALIYGIAALTDVLDGIIARKLKITTKLGRILDPLGDKLMCFAVMLCIAIDGIIPIWAVLVLFIKESIMALGGLLMYEKSSDVFASNPVGKSSTVVFFIVCVILMLVRNISKSIAVLMISGALLLTIIALITYVIKFIYLMKTKKA